MYRGLDRKRKRPYGDDSRLPGSSSKSYFCCEVVNRFRDDINCVCEDIKRLAKLKSDLEALHKNFEAVCLTARQKLKCMATTKIQLHARAGNVTEMKATETRDFLKYTWSLVNSVLDKKAQKSKFMSVRGVRAYEFAEDLLLMSMVIEKDYAREFVHTECSALFTHLQNQLSNLLGPEIAKADSIEFSNTYINSAMPALVSLMSIIDLYLQYPRLSGVITLCNELFYKVPIVSNRPCKTLAMRALGSLLRGTLIGDKPVEFTLPVVEGRVTNFCQLASEMAQYILNKSVPLIIEQQSPVLQALFGPGLLDPRFANNLPPKVQIPLVPQLPPVLVPPVSPIPITNSANTTPNRLTPSRGRGRPRKRAMGPSERPSSIPSPTSNES